MDNKEIFEVLYHCPLFKGLPDDLCEKLLNLIEYKALQYQKGEVIAVEESQCTHIGIIASGTIQIQKTHISGKIVVVDTLQKGNIFGEVIVFSHMHLYPATIAALSDCEVILVSKEEIKKLCSMNSDFLENFLKLLSSKILMLNRKVKVLSYKSIREKIADILLEQHKNQKSLTLMLPFNRNEMADFLGIPRPSLSRELAAMRDEGLIDYYKNTIKIMDVDGLREVFL